MTAATAYAPASVLAEPPTADDLRRGAAFRPSPRQIDVMKSREAEVLLDGPKDCGKAQPLDSIVWTPTGPVCMGDISIGDEVCTPGGGTARVKGIYPQGEQDVYRVTFSDGSSAESTLDHLWAVEWWGGGKRGANRIRVMQGVIPLSKVIKSPVRPGQSAKYWIPSAGAVSLAAKPVPVDPYVIGVLIGDGCIRQRSVSFTSADPDVAADVARGLAGRAELVYDGEITYRLRTGRSRHKIAKRGYVSRQSDGRYMARVRVPGGGARYAGAFDSAEAAQAEIDAFDGDTHLESERTGGFMYDLAGLGLRGAHAWDKRVPSAYMLNSADVRLAVLQGLMDTDGTVDKASGAATFTTVSPGLAADVRFLSESLGGTCSIWIKETTGRLAYNCRVVLEDAASLFRLARKRDIAKRVYPPRRRITDVRHVDRRPCQCISLDSEDGLYLTDRFIVTHNTRTGLEVMHARAMKYPGSRHLLARKTRASLTQSAMVTLRDRVFSEHDRRTVRFHVGDQEYLYPNGSRIVVGGLDDPQRIQSSEYDTAFIPEAIELTLNDWEMVGGLLRYGAMPYGQLMGDCNPSYPKHWLNQRAHGGTTRRIVFRHADNPSITPARLAILQAMTGIRRKRLYEGLWVAAEGSVYEDSFDPAANVIEWFSPPWDWRRWWVVDFGHTHPFVWQAWAEDGDGRLYMYREIYRTKRLVEEHAHDILAATSDDPLPEAIICDHDAEDRATLERHLGLKTVAAWKPRGSVRIGIDAVAGRWRAAADGRPRLFLMRGALVERDPALFGARGEPLPASTEEEAEAYAWNPRRDEPMKENDHGMDCLRYLVARVDRIDKGGIRKDDISHPADTERPTDARRPILAGIRSESW